MTVDELAQIIRAADGENKLGAGALAEAILAAAPMGRVTDATELCAAFDRETARALKLTEALRPFDGLATVVLSEAPPNADFIIVYTDSSGKKWAMRLDELRAARRALSEPDKEWL